MFYSKHVYIVKNGNKTLIETYQTHTQKRYIYIYIYIYIFVFWED